MQAKSWGVDISDCIDRFFQGKKSNNQSEKNLQNIFGDRLDYDEARAMKHEYFDEVTKRLCSA